MWKAPSDQVGWRENKTQACSKEDHNLTRTLLRHRKTTHGIRPQTAGAEREVWSLDVFRDQSRRALLVRVGEEGTGDISKSED